MYMYPPSIIPPPSADHAAMLQDILQHLYEQDKAILKMLTTLNRQEAMLTTLLGLLQRSGDVPRADALSLPYDPMSDSAFLDKIFGRP